MSPQVAAVFDLDGTLMPLPSLERRFLRMLRQQKEIALKNYFSWFEEAWRLLPRGILALTHANKMYLCDVPSFDQRGPENRVDSPRRIPRLSVPRFFKEGVERAECHAMLGHAIVIVSGTLEPLANGAASALETELAARGFATRIRVCATRLEELNGRWTGRILEEAMFGEEKARAVRKVAEEMDLDLSQSWAYGDRSADRWMLQAVGHPTAVNPSLLLRRIARERDWAVLRWSEERNLTERQDEYREEETKCVEQSENEFVVKQPEPRA
ncbi:MAG TPA: HAD-IB family phosphatase [Candidatus Dormibacteraeota bacterium]|nr:HAD-IB family phosphatase [Candidatus Dormibacteraeota bacterium]